MNRTFRVKAGDLKKMVREALEGVGEYHQGEQEKRDAQCPECGTLRSRDSQYMGWAPCFECGYVYKDDMDYEKFKTVQRESDIEKNRHQQAPAMDSHLDEADDDEADAAGDDTEDADDAGGDAAGPSAPQEHESGDSLDAQVDKYLTDYEHEAKSAQQEGLDLRSITRRLLEAEDESEPGAITAAGGAAPQPGAGEIDVESFSNSVVRLIENPENLLEFRDTILKRAANFLAKAYSTEIVDEFKRVMREEHDMEIGKSNFDIEDEYEAPRAGQAGPGGAA